MSKSISRKLKITTGVRKLYIFVGDQATVSIRANRPGPRQLIYRGTLIRPVKRNREPGASGGTDRRTILRRLAALGVVGLAGCSGDGPGETETPTGTDAGGTTTPTTTDAATDTPTPGPTRTPPTVESPPPSVGPADTADQPPSDATVLFGEGVDGLERWQAVGGGDPGWIVEDDYFEVDPGAGSIETVDPIGDCHLHVEFTVPEEFAGETSGNSGVFMMGQYEFQVLDNTTVEEPNSGMAGTYYRQTAPLADPARPSTEWQTFDVLWRAPRFDGMDVAVPARTTMIFNGVVTKPHINVAGATTGGGPGAYAPHPTELPLNLQDHSEPVRFGNVWYRPLPEARGAGRFDPSYGSTYELETDRDLGSIDHQQPEYPPREPDEIERIDPGEGLGDPPSDATVLLEGGDLSGWVGPDGGDPGWREEDGYVAVEPGAGNVTSEESFADAQVHVEFRIPEDVRGAGRGRGNSGVLLADRYEMQVLDNHDNDAVPERWVGAYTGQTAPLASPTRPPGEWQSFDVVWEGPRFDPEGAVLDRYPRLTALLNGVVIQKRLYLDGPNEGGSVSRFNAHEPEQPLGLQENGDEVHFRNVWYRPFA
jgi:hypothetical protein